MRYSFSCCMRYSLSKILYALFLKLIVFSNLYALRCPPIFETIFGRFERERLNVLKRFQLATKHSNFDEVSTIAELFGSS